MKNITKYIVSALFAAAILPACSDLDKKLLTVEVIGKNTIEGFMKEYDGYVAAGEGLHAELRAFYPIRIKYAEIAGDLLNITASAEEGDRLLFNYQMEQQHIATYPRTYWAAGWSVITQVSYILYYGEKNLHLGWSVAQNATVRKIMAQAHFARALAMFDLCNAYAQPYNYSADHSHIGIPILTHIASFDEALPRQSVAEVYAQILDDLGSAMSLFEAAGKELPDAVQKDVIKDCYHISYIACEALLARVYLYMENWEKAASYAKSVMDKVPLSPTAEYINMFRTSQAVPGAESIFRINNYAASSTMSSFFDPTRSGGAKFEPAPVMYTVYAADDIRRQLLTYVPEPGETGLIAGQTPKAVCKYLWKKSISDENLQCHDNFVFRASEMYLIHAEAVLKQSGDVAAASSDLKALIARARGVESSAVSLPSTVDGLLEAVKTERIKELCFEGHRLFDIIRRKEDLVRTNNADVKTISYPHYRFILPIDQMEMQSNERMKQNEGYETK